MYRFVWQKDSYRILICQAISMLILIVFLGFMLAIPQPVMAGELSAHEDEDTEIVKILAVAAGITLIVTLILNEKHKRNKENQEKDSGSDEASHRERHSDRTVAAGMKFSKQLALERSMGEENSNSLPVRKTKWNVLAGYGDDCIFVGVSCRW